MNLLSKDLPCKCGSNLQWLEHPSPDTFSLLNKIMKLSSRPSFIGVVEEIDRDAHGQRSICNAKR
jgi:hypothetical protein